MLGPARRIGGAVWFFVVAVALVVLAQHPDQSLDSKQVGDNQDRDRLISLPFDPATTIDEVSRIVEREFWDENFNGLDWKQAVGERREMVAAATDRDELSIRINDLLRLLKTSHTRYFSVNEPRYYQLMGIFEHVVPENESEKYTYDGIGIETATIDGRHFLQSVFDGFPAAAAGMRYGDQIVRVDGLPFHPIGSFAGRAGSKVEVEIRSAVNAPLKILEVDVVAINARRMFEHAMEASVRQIEKNGRQIGYVHIWSYAGSKYHEQLKQLIFWGPLANCDGLVVDLRDGWGGASPDYVNVFREPIASLESRGRSTEPANYTGVWGKPVVLLVNERTTSGKELFAYVFKKLRLGTVVGSKSAGAVAGGRLFSLNNGDALYLAIAELKIDGQLLEGVGVAPDVIISRPLEFANGADPQLDAALEQFK